MEVYMKKFFVVLSLTIVSALLLTGAVAAALPGTGWWTFYQVQNVGTADGTLTMQAFDSATTTVYDSDAFTFSPGEALAYHPGLAPTYPTGDRIGFTTDLPDGFGGSVVLSSSVPVVAIATLGNNPSGSVGITGGTASAFYQGVGSDFTDTVLNFPTVKHDFYGQTTSFYVQAAGAEADVTITYTVEGAPYTQSDIIGANQMVMFDPAGAGVPTNKLGSAQVVSTTGKIAGVVVEHPHATSPATFALSTRGLTVDDTDYKLAAPTIKNNFYGGSTGFSVQNTGLADALVEITLKVTNATNPALIGVEYTDSELIPAGGSTVFNAVRGNIGGMPAGTFASAVVESIDDATYDPQLLAGTVNETNAMGKAVYTAFAQGAATTSIGVPLVKEMFYGMTTSVAVVNLGSAPTVIYATYTDQNGVVRQFETTTPVDPGAAVNFFKVYTNPSGKFTGLADFSVLEGTKNSVTFESDGVQPIVAIAQESDQDSSNGVLDVKNFEAFALQ